MVLLHGYLSVLLGKGGGGVVLHVAGPGALRSGEGAAIATARGEKIKVKASYIPTAATLAALKAMHTRPAEACVDNSLKWT